MFWTTGRSESEPIKTATKGLLISAKKTQEEESRLKSQAALTRQLKKEEKLFETLKKKSDKIDKQIKTKNEKLKKQQEKLKDQIAAKNKKLKSIVKKPIKK